MGPGILADDLTGALDAAAPFAVGNARVEVWLGRAGSGSFERLRLHAAARTTETRNAAPAVAASLAAEGATALRALGAKQLFKKIDSTLRGPWVEELDAVRAALGDPPAVICPAFPEQGRVVRGGVVYAGGQAGDCFAMLCERSVPRRG